MQEAGESVGVRVGLVVSTALLAIMSAPMVCGKVFVHNDLGNMHLPSRALFAERLAAGESTDWSPAFSSGYYALGEGYGILHPLNRALYSWVPLGIAFNVEIFWPFAAMLVGFALLLVRWDCRRDAAIFGGVVYAFGGYHVLHYVHPTVLAGVAHIPWLLLAIDLLLRAPGSRSAWFGWIAVSLLSTSMALISHIQFVWISALVEGAYSLFLIWVFPGARRRLPLLVLAMALGYLGGAAQLVPLWESFGDSTRVKPSREFLAMCSLPPLNLIQWLSPYFTASRVVTPPMPFGEGVMQPATSMLIIPIAQDCRVHEFAIYPGAVVPVLLVWLLISRRLEPRFSRLAWAAGLLAAVALVLSFGDFTPLFELVRRMPVIGSFRVPGRYMAIWQLGVAVIATVAYASLARASWTRESLPWKQLWPLGLPALAALLICLAPRLPEWAWPWYVRGKYLAPGSMALIGPVLLATAGGLVAFAARGYRTALLALPVLLACDQAAYGIHAVALTPPKDIASYLDAHPVPPNGQDYRATFEKLQIVWHNVYAMKGMRLTDGYLQVAPRKQLSYAKTASRRVAGVAWVRLGNWRSGSWEPFADALPRVRLVANTMVSTDPNRDIDRIDVATTALTDVSLPATSAGVEPGTVRLVGDRPGELDVLTETSARQFLVISESFHRGWQARVDGQRTLVVRAYGDFLGCLVPPGRHSIEFRFRPKSKSAGLWLTMLGLVLTAATPTVARLSRFRVKGFRQVGYVPKTHWHKAASATGDARGLPTSDEGLGSLVGKPPVSPADE